MMRARAARARRSAIAPGSRDEAPTPGSSAETFGEVLDGRRAIVEDLEGAGKAGVFDEPRELRCSNYERNRKAVALRADAEPEQLGQCDRVGVRYLAQIQQHRAGVFRNLKCLADFVFSTDFEFAAQADGIDRRIAEIHAILQKALGPGADSFPASMPTVNVESSTGPARAPPDRASAKRIVRMATSSAISRLPKIRSRIAAAASAWGWVATASTAARSSASPAAMSRECSMRPSV